MSWFALVAIVGIISYTVIKIVELNIEAKSKGIVRNSEAISDSNENK